MTFEEFLLPIFNYGVPTVLVIIYAYKISPSLDNLARTISDLSTEISKLKEVQVSLREALNK